MPLSKPQPGLRPAPAPAPEPDSESEQASVSSASASVHCIGPTKSILKLSPAQTPTRVASPIPEGQAPGAFGKHAHFPPPGQEPTARYSGLDYDRSPIVVLPNICALPERGCPGKTYFQDGRATNPPSLITNPATRAGNHAHPTKLLKKLYRSSPPPLSNVPSSVPPALTHSDTTSSDDYDSDETHSRPLFPLSEPDTVFYPQTDRERARKTSGSSELTLVPTSRCPQGRTGLGVSIGRRPWNSTNESSEDDCLGGF